jgi:hypothetical protein
MTLDERLADAARRIADGLTPPEVDLEGVRKRARAQHRRTVSLTVAAAVVVVLVAATAIGLGRPTAAPLPPVGPLPSDGSTEVGLGGAPPCGHTPEKEPPNQPIESDLQAWIDDLPVGVPPSTPYWHDGVLHVQGAEIDAPYDDVELEVAGETVLVGGYEGGRRSGPSEWLYLRGGGLEPLPVPADQWPSLSADGRIAYWTTSPSPGTTGFVTWDTETNTELATRTVKGGDGGCARRLLLGIDAAGIGYWLDGSSDPRKAPDAEIVRWDVRADTIESTDLTYDPSLTFFEQFDVWVGFEDAYVSPDGTRQVFTGPAPGDSTADCCTNTLRVRPAGPLDSVAPDDIVSLQLPTGVPSMRLWNAWTDRGTWGVWWESDETVLLDAEVDEHSYLVRCSTTDGACELVFDLGTNSSRRVLYMPDWEKDWGFARYPLTS